MHTPPTLVVRSMIATRLASLAALSAAFCPAGPDPMTTKSYRGWDIGLCKVYRLCRDGGEDGNLGRRYRAGKWLGRARLPPSRILFERHGLAGASPSLSNLPAAYRLTGLQLALCVIRYRS